MQRISSLKVAWQQKATFFIVALLVVSVDQLSKLWIELNLAVGESLPETGFFRLTHIRNTGASFGLFQDQSLVLAIVSIIGISVLLYLILFMYRRFHILSTASVKISLGLMLGGTVGNLIDRLSSGYVTDFINFNFWPAFNVADSAVVVGAVILSYSLLRLVKSDELSDGKDT
ncbi:MAG: signal peptidase II [Dehalococcoidales bacterium]|nr:signal peptidase II [Dehalococcoidales bacterium]